MFDQGCGRRGGEGRLTTAALRSLVAGLADLDADVPDAERIEQISLLESLKGAASGAQARVTVAFDTSQREQQAARGVPVRERGRGVAAQVALARRDSPARGSRHLGLARALVHEMPHTLEHLSAGRVSEWRATVLCRETAVLCAADRRTVDARMSGHLPTMGDAAVARTARALAYELDAESVVRRVRGAESDRRVSVRPAPDAMALLTGLLPVAQGVAAFAALDRRAKELIAEGDGRSRGQIMADTLVERVTGQASAGSVPVEVQLVMPAESLLGASDEPASLPGHGPVPAAFARDLLARCAEEGAPLWLRRLFSTPDGQHLVGLERRRRRVDGLLRQFVVLRDQTCRTPWCDAPVRHLDHAVAHRLGGATSSANAQGLCEACNYAKEAPGWQSEVVSAGPSGISAGPRGISAGPSGTDLQAPAHTVRTTTPTGRTYLSTAPPVLASRIRGRPPGHQDAGSSASVLESHLAALLAA